MLRDHSNKWKQKHTSFWWKLLCTNHKMPHSFTLIVLLRENELFQRGLCHTCGNSGGVGGPSVPCKKWKIQGGGGSWVKFPPWWGSGYFLELHIVDCFQCTLLSIWSYIFLLNGPHKTEPKQNSSKTKQHSRSVGWQTAVSQQDIFWWVVTGTLHWLASLHCLFYFVVFDWLRPVVLFFLNWIVCLFVKKSPIWNYPN